MGQPLAITSQEDVQQKQKLNIFEQKDTAAIKREHFAKLGYIQDDNQKKTSNQATFITNVDDADRMERQSNMSEIEPFF